MSITPYLSNGDLGTFPPPHFYLLRTPGHIPCSRPILEVHPASNALCRLPIQQGAHQLFLSLLTKLLAPDQHSTSILLLRSPNVFMTFIRLQQHDFGAHVLSFVDIIMNKAEWSSEVRVILPGDALALTPEVVNGLLAVEREENQSRDHCAALLRALNKPPIPNRVTTNFFEPLADLSRLVTLLRSTFSMHIFASCLACST